MFREHLASGNIPRVEQGCHCAWRFDGENGLSLAQSWIVRSLVNLPVTGFFFLYLRRSPGASTTASGFEPILPSMSVGGEKVWSDPKPLGLGRSLALYVSPMAGFFQVLSGTRI
jgi:hypothetical protein